MKKSTRKNIAFRFFTVFIAGLLCSSSWPVYGSNKASIGGSVDLRGWADGSNPKQVSVPITGGPVLADVDGDYDEHIEVVASGCDEVSKKSIVYLWTQFGQNMPGWPNELKGVKIEGNPAVGDLDRDGDLEIVVTASNLPPNSGGFVYVYHHDGVVYQGYPKQLNYKPGAPLSGYIKNGSGEEPIVYESSKGAALGNIDLDGEKEIVVASSSGIEVVGGTKINLKDWPNQIQAIGSPVVGDADGDGKPEIFLAIKTQSINYIYGWHYDGSAISGWPVDIAGVVNTPGNFISIGDIDGDKKAEIISGSTNSWIAGWHLDGTVAFSKKVSNKIVTVNQPLIGDADGDGKQEIIATTSGGELYLLEDDGTSKTGYPKTLSQGILSASSALFDQDSNGDVELICGSQAKEMILVDLPASGSFNPNKIQWGMYGFNSRNTSNYLRDWDTVGWSVFDDEPGGAYIKSVYDWNRGSRVFELKGAGLNNCYVFKKPDGKPFDSKNSTLQWAMRYNLPFIIYVSIDTMEGKRCLYYTATEGNEPQNGVYIHHGLGGKVKNGRWNTFQRNLVNDLKDAEPNNDIVDVNAVYVQGSGRIDDIMLIKGLPCVDIPNLAMNASVKVSSGSITAKYLNDGDPNTAWVSDIESVSWVEYTWPVPQKVNNINIDNIKGAKSGVIFIVDKDGKVYEIKFNVPNNGGPIEIAFDAIDNVKSIIVVFDNNNSSVSVGEISVFYDINLEKEQKLPEEKYPGTNYIKMKDEYFYDPVKKSYWLPHGIAYQTWNKALGQWQSPSELKNDLDGIVQVGANAIRADFVWKHIETADDVFEWSRYDMLLEEAQARGLRVFPIIGYQWPPDWFPDKWYTMHPVCEKYPNGPWKSDILSYEDPEVRQQFRDFLQVVVKRYSVGGIREDLGDVVAGWILGNEYGYLGLWSIEYDGYDPDCQKAFRERLKDKYNSDITALNNKWAPDNIKTPGYLPNYPYKNFDSVDMPIPFGYQGAVQGKYLARDKASWYDLTQWREESIAGFIAFAAQSVKDVNPYHLISYAAVGMQWGEEDWRYHTEDARKISQACKALDVPLDFWSINNYPWGLENNELMTGQWGIERARHDTGLPVMVTETGFTSTETMYLGIDEKRQANLTRNAVWEALESGAIGVCVFHWNDRDRNKAIGLTIREEGFGIVTKDKKPKPVYFALDDAFKKMEKIDISKYLAGSKDPKRDIAFLWDDSTDSIINRYEAEMNALYGTLERLGYEPTFINDQEIMGGIYLNYKAIVLPRNQKMFEDIFTMLGAIKVAGVKLHADADIPGIMNEYGEPRNKADWLLAIKDLFGIDAVNSKIDPDLEDNIYHDGYETSSFGLNYKAREVFYPAISFNKVLNMWKYRDKIIPDGGIVKATFENGYPALIFHFDTAISLFSLGDNNPIKKQPYYSVMDWTWADRYDWMKTIYMDTAGFGIQPGLIVSNKYILVDYRISADKSVLLSFKNYKPDTVETTKVTTSLITGKKVISLITDELIEDPCDGTIERTLQPDGHDLVLAVSKGTGSSSSSSSAGANSSPPSSSKNNPSASSSSKLNTSSSNSSNSSSNTGSSSKTSSSSNSASANKGSSSVSTTTSPSTKATNYPSIVIVEKNTNSSSNTSAAKTKIDPQSKGSAAQSGMRTYVGNNSITTPSPKEEGMKEVDSLPMEQFQKAMEEVLDTEMGVSRVKPEIVPPSRIQEVINKSQYQSKNETPLFNVVNFANGWLSKLKDWWIQLIGKIKSQF